MIALLGFRLHEFSIEEFLNLAGSVTAIWVPD
jgi:hypothetical protein